MQTKSDKWANVIEGESAGLRERHQFVFTRWNKSKVEKISFCDPQTLILQFSPEYAPVVATTSIPGSLEYKRVLVWNDVELVLFSRS